MSFQISEGTKKLTIKCPSKNEHIQFSDIKMDSERDLAALIPSMKLKGGLLLSEETNLSVGQIVWTWGYPLGYNGPAPLLSVGYLSGFVGYPKNPNSKEFVKHLVVNGAFNAGNSGGALFLTNSDKVIGVVVNKALPLFTPFVKSAVAAFANNPSELFLQEQTKRVSKFLCRNRKLLQK